jgi:ribonuclease M5
MKLSLDALIVVEGTSDVQVLNTIVDAEFLTTNGSAVSLDTIDFIKHVKNIGKEVIVFTDPDHPGEKIRQTLNESIPGLSHAFVDKAFAIKHGKVGIAETNPEVLLQALRDKIKPSQRPTPHLTIQHLSDLDLIGNNGSQEKRMKICKYFHIGHCNAKTMLKRLNFIGATKEALEGVIQ